MAGSGRKALRMLYLIFLRLLGLFLLLSRSPEGKDVELLALRYENQVLRRRLLLPGGESRALKTKVYDARRQCAFWNSIDYDWLPVNPDQLAAQAGVSQS